MLPRHITIRSDNIVRATFNRINEVANQLGLELVRKDKDLRWVALPNAKPCIKKAVDNLGSMAILHPRKLSHHEWVGWIGELCFFWSMVRKQIRKDQKKKRQDRIEMNIGIWNARRDFYEYDHEIQHLDAWDHFINQLYR